MSQIETKRQCIKCKAMKFEEEFNFRVRRGGRRLDCQDCQSRMQKGLMEPRHIKRRASRTAFRERHKERLVEYNRQVHISGYGITVDAYNALFEAQGGVCALCGKEESLTRKGQVQPLAIDHDHRTGKVRGLLCNKCNIKLVGIEDAEFVNKALLYLARYK